MALNLVKIKGLFYSKLLAMWRMYRLNLLVKRWGLKDRGKVFSERIWNIKTLQDRLLSKLLIAMAAAFYFAIECGACVSCHGTRRMEWRRGDEWVGA